MLLARADKMIERSEALRVHYWQHGVQHRRHLPHSFLKMSAGGLVGICESTRSAPIRTNGHIKSPRPFI
jgi:hypothetical protein